MKRGQLFASAAGVALGAAVLIAAPGVAPAQEVGTMAYYNLTPEEKEKDAFEWKLFLTNWHREPCQKYVAPPEGFRVVGCDVHRISQVAVTPYSVTEIEPAAGEAVPLMNYSQSIYFDFDRSHIRPGERPVLDRAIADIRRLNPAEVTVAGHADTAGPMSYNEGLSAERAQTVRQELTAGGIDGSIIRAQAYGERAPAVSTPDDTPEQGNRRVVIDFQYAGGPSS